MSEFLKKAGLTAMFGACAQAAAAATVLSVTGPDTGDPPAFQNAGAFAVSLDADGPITGADIFAEYTCLTLCSGSAILLDDFGPSSTILAAGSYNGASDFVLSGVTLIDGLNVLLLTVDEGIIVWGDTAAPNIVANLASPLGSFVSTEYNDSLPWNSEFRALVDTALKYRIEVTTVPLPASALLLGSALFGGIVWSRRRRRSS